MGTVTNIAQNLAAAASSTATNGSAKDCGGPLMVGRVGVWVKNGSTPPSAGCVITVLVSEDGTNYFSIVINAGIVASTEYHYNVNVSGWRYVNCNFASTSQSVDKRADLTGIANV